MPHRPPQSPHPRNFLNVGGRNCPVLCNCPWGTETEAPTPTGPDPHPTSLSAPAVAVLPERRRSYMLHYETRHWFCRVSCGGWAGPYHKVLGFVYGGKGHPTDEGYLVRYGLFRFRLTINGMNSHEFSQGSLRLVRVFANCPSYL